MPADEVFVEAGGREIRISSAHKVMFPEQGWTKLDVVEHYLHAGRTEQRKFDEVVTCWERQRHFERT